MESGTAQTIISALSEKVERLEAQRESDATVYLSSAKSYQKEIEELKEHNQRLLDCLRIKDVAIQNLRSMLASANEELEEKEKKIQELEQLRVSSEIPYHKPQKPVTLNEPMYGFEIRDKKENDIQPSVSHSHCEGGCGNCKSE